MSHIYINPEMITKIEKKVAKLAKTWDYDKNDIHTLWQMVASIESGEAKKVFYEGDGIVCDGWNGYRGVEGNNTNPQTAFGGFYRLDTSKMVGWSIYLIARADDKADQANRCYEAYGHWFVWEDEKCVNGFVADESFYTEDEAKQAEENEKNRKGFKRSEVKYSDTSGCYHLRVMNSRCKPNLKNVYKARVPAKG